MRPPGIEVKRGWAPGDGTEGLRQLFAARSQDVLLLDGARRESLTFGEAAEISGRLGAALLAEAGEQGRVLLLLDNSVEFALLYLACLQAGLVAVPVSPMLAVREILFIAERSRAALVVCSPRTGVLVPAGSATAKRWLVADSGAGEGWSVRETVPGGGAGLSAFERTDLSALLAITFTSGTTSLPKGVAHRGGRLLENAASFNRHMGFDENRRFLHVFPMAYMAGFLNTLLGPMLTGGAIVLGRQFDATSAMRFWDTVVENAVDTLWLAPTMLAALMRLDRSRTGVEYVPARIKSICVGTAPLASATKSTFEERYGAELFESYGLSELLLVSGNTPLVPRVPGSVGPLLPGVTASFGDATEGQQGSDGEIHIRTPFAMAGYIDYETGRPVPPSTDSFPTGDIGHLSESGDLFITGRKKDLIIRGGTNVSPRAVEDVLLEHEAVEQAAVIGLPHDFLGEEVVAVVQLRDAVVLEAVRMQMEELCRRNLAAAAIPTRWVQVDGFPVGITGKIQKHELRKRVELDIRDSGR